MCQNCGCQQFIKEGKGAALRRAVEIVKELRLTPANVDDYEATETVSGFIAPFGLRQDQVFQTASWISDLHQGVSRTDRQERYQAHERALRDIFSRLPVQGDARHIATTYHQLEQLAREVDEKAMASLEPEVRQAIEAVNHVHEDTTRAARLKERYGL